MVISIRKTIPATSNFYTGGGDATIILAGTTKFIVHTKKDLIKINRRKTKSRQTSEDSDEFDNRVVDLKNGTDEIIITGWLEDENFIDSTCDTTSSSTTITCDSSSSINVGQLISGTGIPANSVVSTVNTPGAVTSFTISNAATASNTNTSLTFEHAAWEKFWKLRAMCSRGGALTNLTIENIIFSSSTQGVFLEDIVATKEGDGTGPINVAVNSDTARLEVVLTFFIGDER